MSAQLQFSISNQEITRTDDFHVVAESVDYLYAQFTFLTEEWSGRTITAQFKSNKSSKTYEYILDENNTCVVPWESLELEGGGYLYVSVFAGALITTNRARVFVAQSGYDSNAESASPPTPSVYQQILNKLDEIESGVATQIAEVRGYIDEQIKNIDGGTFEDWKDED